LYGVALHTKDGKKRLLRGSRKESVRKKTNGRNGERAYLSHHKRLSERGRKCRRLFPDLLQKGRTSFTRKAFGLVAIRAATEPTS